MVKMKQAAVVHNGKKPKRQIVSQTFAPRLSLEQSLVLAKGLVDEFAGQSASPHQLAFALDISPTSSNWERVTGASIAYGLTEGGCNSQQITLTELGRRVVTPTVDGDDLVAKREACLKPKIMQDFFTKYHRAKFPSDAIASNIIATMGVPKERVPECLEILKANGNYVGFIVSTKTGPFVATDSPAGNSAEATPLQVPADPEQPPVHKAKDESASLPLSPTPTPRPESNRKVFITHGKDRRIVQQLKEILTFGKFEPIVSVERETTAIGVPDKVFNDMRQCAAGIIHVMSEGDLLDQSGNKVIKINDNVLIEIGAAIALFRNRVILLVEKGVKLPSNLQGLYYCSYEGDKLDYEATMKLLKTFNEFQM